MLKNISSNIYMNQTITKSIIKPFNQSMIAAPEIQKGFFQIMVGEVHLWVILFCALSMMMLIGVLTYVFREWIQLQWLKVTKPQKLIKIFIHYPGAMESIHYRIIPKTRKFNIDGKNYYFSPDAIERDKFQNDIPKPDYLKSDLEDEKFKFIIDGKQYEYDADKRIKFRWDRFPKIHYFYDNPIPIDWGKSSHAGKLTSVEDSEMDESNLFVQLLKYSETKQMLLFVLVLVIVCILVSAATALKVFGVLK